MITHSPLNFKLDLIFLIYLFFCPHTSTLHLSCAHKFPTQLQLICPFIDPFVHSSLLVSSFQLPSSPLFSFTSHLWSLAPSFLSLPHPVHFVPSSLPLSLSHSALCLALSGWAAPRWLRVCVHSGACRASPPPGLTTRFCLSPLKFCCSSSFPFLPHHLPTLHFSSATPQDSIPPWCRQHPLTSSPSYLLTFHCPFLPVGSTLLSSFSLVHPQNSFCLKLNFGLPYYNCLLKITQHIIDCSL